MRVRLLPCAPLFHFRMVGRAARQRVASASRPMWSRRFDPCTIRHIALILHDKFRFFRVDVRSYLLVFGPLDVLRAFQRGACSIAIRNGDAAFPLHQLSHHAELGGYVL